MVFGKLSGEDNDGRLLRLIHAGIVRPGRTDPPQGLFRDNPPRAQSATSIVELLLQERRDGR